METMQQSTVWYSFVCPCGQTNWVKESSQEIWDFSAIKCWSCNKTYPVAFCEDFSDDEVEEGEKTPS
jgi:hypothetical protein